MAVNSKTMAADDHRHSFGTLPPVAYILIGLIVGFFWIWGNLVQIQTSEAWMANVSSSGVSLIPHFALVAQLASFWSGNLTQDQIIADTWGWGIQIILFICSVGIERPQMLIHRKYNKGVAFSEGASKTAEWRGNIYISVSVILIALNSIADFKYSSAGDFWHQLAFAGMTLVMSFYFGLISIHLIVAGWTEFRKN